MLGNFSTRYDMKPVAVAIRRTCIACYDTIVGYDPQKNQFTSVHLHMLLVWLIGKLEDW